MIMMKYKYTGDNAVVIDKVGLVQPGEVVETEVEINHPLFEVQSKSKEKREKELDKE